jgi:hypothetical protein
MRGLEGKILKSTRLLIKHQQTSDFRKKIPSNYDFQLPLTLKQFEDFYEGYHREKLMS